MGNSGSVLPATTLNTAHTTLGCFGQGFANNTYQEFDFTISLRAPTVGPEHKDIFYQNVTVSFNHTGSLPNSTTNAAVQISLLTNNVIPFSWVLTPAVFIATGGSQPVFGSFGQGKDFGPVTLGNAGNWAQYSLGDVGIDLPQSDGSTVHLDCPHSSSPPSLGSTFITPW